MKQSEVQVGNIVTAKIGSVPTNVRIVAVCHPTQWRRVVAYRIMRLDTMKVLPKPRVASSLHRPRLCNMCGNICEPNGLSICAEHHRERPLLRAPVQEVYNGY
jgi:hypothetical protein